MDIEKLLKQVVSGEISTTEAAKLLESPAYEDIGFAKLDHNRRLRRGFGEVIFCAGKTVTQAVEIFQRFADKNEDVLGTRATLEQYEAIKYKLPDATWEPYSRTIIWRSAPAVAVGAVAVCTGGTADMPVAEEAAMTAEFFGARVNRFYDVGVAGIHRLFDKLEQIRNCNCIIAAAGMEGALAGVIAGLVDVPVIAVPTSVGYGASFQGLAPLLTMLNSCAEGVGVVNIDNGFGAGYLAAQINRLAIRGGNVKE